MNEKWQKKWHIDDFEIILTEISNSTLTLQVEGEFSNTFCCEIKNDPEIIENLTKGLVLDIRKLRQVIEDALSNIYPELKASIGKNGEVFISTHEKLGNTEINREFTIPLVQQKDEPLKRFQKQIAKLAKKTQKIEKDQDKIRSRLDELESPISRRSQGLNSLPEDSD